MLYVQDAIRRIDQFTEELITNMPAISTDVAGLFLVAKIEQIRKIGIGTYSSNVYGASFLKGKQLSSAGESFLEGKIKRKEKTNWSQLRQAESLQVAFVDVTYSGQMLGSTGIELSQNSGRIFYSIIGGRNDEAKKKLYYNYFRYGRFLHPNSDQEKLIGNRAILLVGNIYKRILLTS